MLRRLTALSVLALSLFAAKAAHAEWLMFGAYDFQPFDKTTTYNFSGGRGGYVSSGFTSVRVPLKVPFGKKISQVYCQVMDVSAAKDVSMNVTELQSTDDSTTWGLRTIMSGTSAGVNGHGKIWMYPGQAAATVKSWECPGTCYYYAYYLTVSLPDTSNTNIKACAVMYE